MDTKSSKKNLTHWINSIDDPELLKELWKLKKTQKQPGSLSDEQLNELEKRLSRYKSGEMEFTDWKTVNENIRKKSQNAV